MVAMPIKQVDLEADEEGNAKMPDKMNVYEVFRVLGENSLSIDDWTNFDGLNPLHIACREGLLEMVEAILAMRANVNRRSDKEQKTPLYFAAKQGHTAIVSYLLSHGATVYEKGQFAFHEAAYRGHADVVKLLVDAGVNVLEKQYGYSAAQKCVMTHSPSSAARKGKAAALKCILDNGGDVKDVDEGKGWTLLHYAALNGLTECIPVLVAKGLHPDTPSHNRTYTYTALHMACGTGKEEVVKELVKSGASLEAVDSKGRTALYDGLKLGKYEVVRTMIRLGACVNAKYQSGITLLHVAAAFGGMRAAYLLVEAGADVDAMTQAGDSPLLICLDPHVPSDFNEDYESFGSFEARAKVARFLMEMGAKVDGKAMEYAIKGGMKEIITDRLKQLTEIQEARNSQIAYIARTLLAHHADVVTVRLVHRRSGEVVPEAYQLNTQLVKLLAGMKQRGNEPEGLMEVSHTAFAYSPSHSVLSRFLEPDKYGFDSRSDGVCDGRSEVKLEYDGSDFTEDGFAAAVMYLTTGSVERLLVNKRPRGRSGVVEEKEGSNDGGGDDVVSEGNDDDDEAGSGIASDVGSCVTGGEMGNDDAGGGGGGGSSYCLFDEEKARKTLQAAQFFCLEWMAEEVKRLMDIYGFEYHEE